MGKFSNRSQKMSEWGENISDTLHCNLSATSSSYHILKSSVIHTYHWRETQKKGIYLINWYYDVIELAVYINLFD